MARYWFVSVIQRGWVIRSEQRWTEKGALALFNRWLTLQKYTNDETEIVVHEFAK